MRYVYLSEKLARTLEDTLKEVESRVKKLCREVKGDGFTTIGFVDGSYVLEERRGACLALLSAATLIIEGERISRVMEGSKRPLIFPLIPRTYGESRMSLLMETFELVGGLDLIRRGVEAVFMDGSYVSGLMEPFTLSRVVNDVIKKIDRNLLNEYGKQTFRSFKEIIAARNRDPWLTFRDIIRVVGDSASELYENLEGLYGKTLGRREMLDLSMIYLETTAYLSSLRALLKEAEEKGVGLFWVAKDSESRYIVDKEGVKGWMNDLTLLDYAWRDKERVYLSFEDMKMGKPSVPVAYDRLLEEIYEKWGDHGVAYFKLSPRGAVIQTSYPENISKDTLSKALATLARLTDPLHGYPRPLNYVHNMTVLSQSLSRIIADEIYRKADRGTALKFILAPSGRGMIGLS